MIRSAACAGPKDWDEMTELSKPFFTTRAPGSGLDLAILELFRRST